MVWVGGDGEDCIEVWPLVFSNPALLLPSQHTILQLQKMEEEPEKEKEEKPKANSEKNNENDEKEKEALEAS
eukprot:gene26243-biopygen15229